jgi:hypothetical protein
MTARISPASPVRTADDLSMSTRVPAASALPPPLELERLFTTKGTEVLDSATTACTIHEQELEIDPINGFIDGPFPSKKMI